MLIINDRGAFVHVWLLYHCLGNQTLRTLDSWALKHFCTVQNFEWIRSVPGISALVPKCPNDTSDLSTKLSSPMVRTIPPYGPKCPTLWSEVSHLSLWYLQHIDLAVFSNNMPSVCLRRNVHPIPQPVVVVLVPFRVHIVFYVAFLCISNNQYS